MISFSFSSINKSDIISYHGSKQTDGSPWLRDSYNSSLVLHVGEPTEEPFFKTPFFGSRISKPFFFFLIISIKQRRKLFHQKTVLQGTKRGSKRLFYSESSHYWFSQMKDLRTVLILLVKSVDVEPKKTNVWFSSHSIYQ